MTTGELIKKKRGSLSLRQLSELCGIRDTTLRKYENGDRNPKIETLAKIAKALNCNVIELMPPPNEGEIVAAFTDENGNTTIERDMLYDLDNVQKAIDDAYIDKLRVPALKLNQKGRDLLFNQAELYTTMDDFTDGKKD